jgi:hypothetical protein
MAWLNLPHLVAPVAPLVVVLGGQVSHLSEPSLGANVSTGHTSHLAFTPPAENRPGLQQNMSRRRCSNGQTSGVTAACIKWCDNIYHSRAVLAAIGSAGLARWAGWLCGKARHGTLGVHNRTAARQTCSCETITPHSPHLVAPVAPLVVVPAGQSSHLAEPSVAANLSAGHCSHFALTPPVENRPGLPTNQHALGL